MLSRSSLLLVVLAATVACDKVPLGAPGGSTITVTTPVSSIALNGSTEISAFVTEDNGSPVQNGTTVRFTTTLGTLDPAEAQTRNGVATTTLRAGTISGVAQIRATSGAGAGGTGETQTNVAQVRIGAAAAGAVAVSASPSSVPSSGGTVTITAAVFDAAGNPLTGVPVSFTTTAGSLSASAATTGSNGEAKVQLTTERTATVVARVGGTGAEAVSGEVQVNVAAANSISVTLAPASPVVGTPVVATITPTIGANNLPPRVTINWGDGNQEDLGVVAGPRSLSHTYTTPGTYAVVVTATSEGETTTASATVVVAPVNVTITASPASGPVSTVFSFVVTPSTGSSVENMRVEFGDGSSVDLGPITGATSVTKRYASEGSYTVRAVQTNSNGSTGSGEVIVTVN